MKNQIGSEFRKLVTTRSVYAMLAGLLLVVGLGVVAITTGGEPGSLSGPVEHQTFMNASLTIAPLFGLLLGLRAFTDEFRYGSIVPTLLVSPIRRRVLGGKLVATAGGGVVLSVIAVAVSIAIGVPILIVKGMDVTWSIGGLAVVVGRLAGATVLWTALGVGLGLAVKHQVAAVAGTLVWILAAEGILSGLVPHVAKYFPGAAGFAVVGLNPAELLTPALGALLLGAYALVAVALGSVLMQRRDIT